MIFNFDGTWLPDAACECYNNTKVGELHCAGCMMRNYVAKTMCYSLFKPEVIEIVDRETCPWFKSLIEINKLSHKVEELKSRLSEIHERAEISEDGRLKKCQ